MNLVWLSLAWAALASCSADPGSDEVAPPPLVTEAETQLTGLDSLFREDFRTGYASVLWTMMVLRWCDERWNRPPERAKAEARLAAIEAQALSLGLKADMQQAAQDNAQMMATMRLDTGCSGGFERAQNSAAGALTQLERFLGRRTQKSQLGGSPGLG